MRFCQYFTIVYNDKCVIKFKKDKSVMVHAAPD